MGEKQQFFADCLVAFRPRGEHVASVVWQWAQLILVGFISHNWPVIEPFRPKKAKNPGKLAFFRSR
jgi:hypothetical protein